MPQAGYRRVRSSGTRRAACRGSFRCSRFCSASPRPIGFLRQATSASLLFRSIGAAQMLWCSVAGNSRFQDGDDIHSPDRPRRMHPHTLARIVVEDRQNPEPAAVLGLVFDKVPTPDLPRPLGPGPLCGRGSYPLHASLLLAHLDAFLSPDASHPLRVDLKALTPQQRRDATVT